MSSPSTSRKHSSSFRDPFGRVYVQNGQIFRRIMEEGRSDFDMLMSSGLYDDLVRRSLLIPHTESKGELAPIRGEYLVIRPDQISTISYPYEWSFSQLKDAALATLTIQQAALKKHMTLKDASAFNIQFHHGKPILIDTLSFVAYNEGEAWVAYRQFCQHFLAPLALMAYVDHSLLRLFSSNIDGIPLSLTAKLLPRKAALSPGILLHLVLHARAQNQRASAHIRPAPTLSLLRLNGLIDSLVRTVTSLKWKTPSTEWADYYTFTNYSKDAFDQKKRLVSDLIRRAAPKTTWDLGGNTGEFSRLAVELGSNTVCFDIDPVAVERNYLAVREKSESQLLPLQFDLTNPSPAIGWANQERQTLAERGPVDLVMSLALIHHLAISNNLPFENIAAYFASLGRKLLIEFVPKSDSMVKILFSSRPDIFPDYTMEGFEAAFGVHFRTIARIKIPETERILYLFELNG